MKIYVFKNLLSGNYLLPIYAESEEEMRFNLEVHLRKLIAEKKQFDLRMNKKRELYYMGEYNEKDGHIETKPLTLILKVKDVLEQVEDDIKKEMIEQYQTQLEIKEAAKNGTDKN